MSIKTEWRDYDVIVVGSGGAGCAAARAAAQAGANVLVVSKDPIGCSDTKISEGVATVRGTGTHDDTEVTLSENLRMAGADLPLKSLTDAFAKDSQAAYDEYRNNGLRPAIDSGRDTPQAMPLPMGGHNQRRSVAHENSGVAFAHASCDAVIKTERIDYLEDTWFLDLVTTSNDEGGGNDKSSRRVVGGVMYDATRGKLIAARAPAVVIASGGLSTLFFPKTDTMRGNTGDSYAVAMRAGADLVDMEQVQFLPFCLTSPPSYEGLLVGEPSSASYLGVLRDQTGKVILDSVYLRTRAECSLAIMRAVADGRGSPNGGAWLDMTANKKLPRSGPWFTRFIETSLAGAYRNARQAMSKPAARCDEPWEVRPSAHYHMGGIRVDENCASAAGPGNGDAAQGVSGLFAAGQAMGGLFGANRLGSTSLTEVAVFGNRAGRAAAKLASTSTYTYSGQEAKLVFEPIIESFVNCFGRTGTKAAATVKLELQRDAWENIGPMRSAEGLQRFEQNLARWRAQLDDVAIPSYGVWNQSFIEYQELRNMLDAASAVASAATERNVSVGGHVRQDCKNVSVLAKPYSTVVNCAVAAAGQASAVETLSVFRVERTRTPPGRAIVFKIKARWQKLQATLLRLAPASYQDAVLEQRYRATMGGRNQPDPVQPGSSEAAVAEVTHA